MQKTSILVLAILLAVPLSHAGSPGYPEWRDDLADNAPWCWAVCDPTQTGWPNPFMDLQAGWVEVWTDEAIDAYLQLAVVPPVPGIGAPGNGISYVYYWMYLVNDPSGQRPNYGPYPPAGGTYLYSFAQAAWWDTDGPQNDPIWEFQYGYEYYTPGFYHFISVGDLVGDVDLVSSTLHWKIPRGLSQTLIPTGCDAEGWTLQRMHGFVVWFATVGGIGIAPSPAPMEDRGPNVGYGRPFDFPACPDSQYEEGRATSEYSVGLGSGELAERRVEFKDPFNGTLSYSWETAAENVTIAWDSLVEEGSLDMFVYDGAGDTMLTVRVDEDTTDDLTVRGANPGNWTVILEFDFYSREFGFELADADSYEPSGQVGGEVQNGEAEAEPEAPEQGAPSPDAPDTIGLQEDRTQQETAKRTPGIPFMALLGMIVVFALLRRK